MRSSPRGGGFSLSLLEERPGIAVLRITGEGVLAVFAEEAGGHRWQRVPKNEKRGRVHSSTVTVAVLPEPTTVQLPTIREADLEISYTRGSGAGGQHRNVTDSAVVVKHLPSGLTVRCEAERSQHANRETALNLLRARLWEAKQASVASQRASTRREQVGTAERSDKRRTVAVQRDEVIDHVTGRVWRFADYVRGRW